MGIEHRKAVEAIPPGLMHPDERMVLTVLATETNDSRLEWAHDRKKLLGILGLRDNRAGREWLRCRLKALEDAGWIKRKDQPRLDDGRWGWALIRLRFRELGDSMSLDQYLNGGFTPTPRSEDGRHPNHVFTSAERMRGYERGLKKTTGTAVESEPSQQLRAAAGTAVESGRVQQLRATSPDHPDIEPGHSLTLAPDGAEVAGESHPLGDGTGVEDLDVVLSTKEAHQDPEGQDGGDLQPLGRIIYDIYGEPTGRARRGL